MKLEEMELELARFDAIIGKPPKAAANLARFQRLRDDLDVQIGLKRIRLGAYQRRTLASGNRTKDLN
jgi:hypothetical protein